MIAFASNPESTAECVLSVSEERSGQHSGQHQQGGYERGVKRSIHFMVQHQDQPLQVAKLASVANICPSHYFAVFKQVTGFTPMDFFIRLRMRQACRLLDTTRLSVKQVAAALGYEDPFYFSRVFKSVNGLAPTDYRTLEACRREGILEAALPIRNGRALTLHDIENSIQTTCVSS